jgi:branched-chain amino acid transport system substrate-binding protein
MQSISRRSFLTMTSTWGLRGMLGAGGLFSAVSIAAQPQPSRTVRIAHLSQRAGTSAEMANYAVMGARLGAEEANTTAQMFGTSVELITEEAMEPAQLIPTARKLTAQPGLVAIIGALDEAMTVVLSEFTQQEGVVLLNTTARGGALRGAQCRRSTFHTVADVAMNVDAIGQWLVQNNRKRWHFVAAEDALGQEVYRRASRLLQAQGGTELGREVMRPGRPDYQLLLERVGQQDAEVIFVALRGEDLRQFLGQYTASGLTALVSGAPLDMIAVWSTPPTHVKGVWATSWYHQFERYSARELNRRFLRRFGKPAEAYAWANWAAVKLVVEGVLRTGSTDPAALVSYLEGAPAFDGHKGKSLTFRDWNHQLRQPMYIVQARDGPPENPWDVFEIVSEMPPPTARGKSVADILDTLGESKAETKCQLQAF